MTASRMTTHLPYGLTYRVYPDIREKAMTEACTRSALGSYYICYYVAIMRLLLSAGWDRILRGESGYTRHEIYIYT